MLYCVLSMQSVKTQERDSYLLENSPFFVIIKSEESKWCNEHKHKQ